MSLTVSYLRIIAFALLIISGLSGATALGETPKSNVWGGPVFTNSDPWGDQVGTFNAVPAYSNGNHLVTNIYNYDTGINTGMKWQCVEYVNRYYYLEYGMNIRVAGDNANNYFPNALNHGLTPYNNGGPTPPQIGDILCSNGNSSITDNVGHVALVRDVQPGQITVIQQNWSNSSADNNFVLNMTFDGTNYTVDGWATNYPVTGWLRGSVSPDGISIASVLRVEATRDSPNTIYSLPDEYSNDQPTESDKNLFANFSLRNTSGVSITLDDYGVEILKEGAHQFYLRQGEPAILSDNDVVEFDLRAWITDARLTNGSTTNFSAQVQYQKDGNWENLSTGGGLVSFDVEPRPQLSNGMIIKSPRLEGDVGSESAKIYYHQWGYKWWLSDETDANNLFPGWNSEFYVYPENLVSGLGDPKTPDHDLTIPVMAGQNLLFKKTGFAPVYIIEPEPGTTTLVSRPFDTEENFWSYGYSSSATPNDIVSQTVELGAEADWLFAQYPVGSTIESTTPFVIQVSGTINTDTHWTSDHIYHVMGTLIVATGATLTVDPGTVVKVKAASNLALQIDGALNAQGTALDPIIFTSDRDDAIDGHDTNGDNMNTLPEPGNWYNIRINGNGSRMEHCRIRYAGNSGGYGKHVVILSNRTAVMDNCTIELVYGSSPAAIYCSGYANDLTNNTIRSAPTGILVSANPTYPDTTTISGNNIDISNGIGITFNGNPDNSVLHITNNQITCPNNQANLAIEEVKSSSTISNNTLNQGAVGIWLNDASPSLTDNALVGTVFPFAFVDDADTDISNNTFSAVGHKVIAHSGTMRSSHQWSELIGGTYRHYVTGTLIVASGATLTVDPGTVVKVKAASNLALQIDGALNAQGTALDPIIFTSGRDDAIDGHDTNGDNMNTLPEPGNWYNIRVNGNGSRMEHCRIRYAGNSGGYGKHVVILANRANVMDNCTIELVYGSSPAAIYCSGYANDLTNNTIRSAPNGILVSANPTYPDTISITGNDIDVTLGNGINFNGNPDNSVLTLSGNTIHSNGAGTGIYVKEVRPGSLIVGNNVYDSALALSLTTTSAACLQNILWQGAGSAGTGTGITIANDCDILLEGNVVSEFSRGVYGWVTGGSAPSTIQMTGNQIINNAQEGIYLGSSNSNTIDGPDAVINFNDIYGNGSADLYLASYRNPDTRHIDATNNWWGTASEAAIPALIHDQVDDPPVSPTADYLPILGQASGTLIGSLWVTPSDLSADLFPGTQLVRDLMLGNRGTEDISYSLFEGADAPAKTDVEWLDIASPSGIVEPGEVGTANVVINATGMSDGHYRAHVVVQSDDPVNDLVVVPVEMEVSHVFLFGPAPGDTLDCRDLQPLTWAIHQSSSVSSVDLSFSTDGGISFSHVIEEGLPNQSPYTWDVAGGVGDSCSVRITVHYQDGSQYSNTTKSFFTIINSNSPVDDNPALTRVALLKQNFPNPFNPSTTISYYLPDARHVDLTVFDISGRLISRLVNQPMEPGEYSVQWDGTDIQGTRVSSGVYFYRLNAGSLVDTKRMILVK